MRYNSLPLFFVVTLISCYRKEAIQMEGTYTCTKVTHYWDELNGYSSGSFDTTIQSIYVDRSKFNNLEINNFTFEAWELRNGNTAYSGDSLTDCSLRIINDSIIYSETYTYTSVLGKSFSESRFWGKKD